MSNHSPIRDFSQGAYGEILQALKKHGTSLHRWATAHGYEVRTVYMTARRWAGRTDRHPHGGIARRIMADLRADLGPEIVSPVKEPVKTHPPQEKAA